MTIISRAFSAVLAVSFFSASFALSQELRPLSVKQVKLGGEMGRRLDATINNNFMVIDVDRVFLVPFQEKRGNTDYIGLGKFIDSAVRFAAYSCDEKVIARKKHLVEMAIAAQEPDGYLGIFTPAQRMKTLWDVHEMSYLVLGLTADWRYFEEKRSLEAARKLADYMIEHWKEIPADWSRQTRAVDFLSTIGMDCALIALSQVTGDRKYMEFCIEERKLLEWNQEIVIGRRPGVAGHVYAFVSRCVALQDFSLYAAFDAQSLIENAGRSEAPRASLQDNHPKEITLKQPRKAWDFLVDKGLTITGGCGHWECWADDQDGRGALGETCATAYQLRLYDRALRNGAYISNSGDLMERTITNALFAAQSPDGRSIRYYAPFEGNREYFNMDRYCCPCNYRRIIAELPEMVYYHSDLRGQNRVVVNLYTPSTAEIPLTIDPNLAAEGAVSEAAAPATESSAENNGKATKKTIKLKLRQETDYPNSGKIALSVDPAKELRFEIALRIPLWCKKPTVKINGRETPDDGTRIQPPSAGHYCSIHRLWKPGDRVEIDLPMEWRFVLGRDRQAGRVAVMRGPTLFCLDPLRKENAAFKDWDGADLGRCTIIPESIEGPNSDDGVRPGGMSCRVKVFRPGCNVEAPDASFLLTEFPDPDGRAVYFRLQDLSAGVKDELLGPVERERTTLGW